MSWQAYIDRMVQTKVQMAGIFGKCNCCAWGSTPNFQPQQAEVAHIVDVLNRNDSSIYTTGVTLCGQQWTVICMEPDMLILKGKRDENAKQNMVIALSNQAVIFGANIDENITGGTIRVSVEGMRDYLKSVQY